MTIIGRLSIFPKYELSLTKELITFTFIFTTPHSNSNSILKYIWQESCIKRGISRAKCKSSIPPKTMSSCLKGNFPLALPIKTLSASLLKFHKWGWKWYFRWKKSTGSSRSQLLKWLARLDGQLLSQCILLAFKNADLIRK